MRALSAVLAAFALAACGGGGSPPSSPAVAPLDPTLVAQLSKTACEAAFLSGPQPPPPGLCESVGAVVAVAVSQKLKAASADAGAE